MICIEHSDGKRARTNMELKELYRLLEDRVAFLERMSIKAFELLEMNIKTFERIEHLLKEKEKEV